MDTFNTIVAIAEGLTIICGLLALLVKPIREKITHSKERDEKQQKNFEELRSNIKEVKGDVDGIMNSITQDKATRARTQILRFADEIYRGTMHTKEHFDETLDAITFYNQYCDSHPDFKNFRTVNAQKLINDIYQQCQREHTFLDSREE